MNNNDDFTWQALAIGYGVPILLIVLAYLA